MKAILVIDKPDSCEECPLRSYSNLELVCTPMRKGATDIECPLKPMPSRQYNYDSEMDIGYTLGWNYCIERLEE